MAREIELIPATRADLKEFIKSTIRACSVRTDILFGFYDESLPPDEQRYGGFGVGRFAEEEEICFLDLRLKALKDGPKRPSKHYKNEADAALAARAFHAVVLSDDRKPGPLRDVKAQGGKVLLWMDFVDSQLLLRDFIILNVRG